MARALIDHYRKVERRQEQVARARLKEKQALNRLRKSVKKARSRASGIIARAAESALEGMFVPEPAAGLPPGWERLMEETTQAVVKEVVARMGLMRNTEATLPSRTDEEDQTDPAMEAAILDFFLGPRVR